MDDPEALAEKSSRLREKDPVESARLLRRAQELGWRERTRQEDMNELATPPS